MPIGSKTIAPKHRRNSRVTTISQASWRLAFPFLNGF
jgi:hypothetical protein